jgi:hypothetical protein
VICGVCIREGEGGRDEPDILLTEPLRGRGEDDLTLDPFDGDNANDEREAEEEEEEEVEGEIFFVDFVDCFEEGRDSVIIGGGRLTGDFIFTDCLGEEDGECVKDFRFFPSGEEEEEVTSLSPPLTLVLLLELKKESNDDWLETAAGAAAGGAPYVADVLGAEVKEGGGGVGWVWPARASWGSMSNEGASRPATTPPPTSAPPTPSISSEEFELLVLLEDIRG